MSRVAGVKDEEGTIGPLVAAVTARPGRTAACDNPVEVIMKSVRSFAPVLLAALVVGLSPSAKANAIPPNGAYVVNPAGCVCIMLDGKKRWVCGEVWDQILHRPEGALIRLSDEEFNAIPTGPAYAPNGTLIRNPAGCICVVWGDQKRWLSAEVWPLVKRGWVLNVPDVVFEQIPTGPPVDANLALHLGQVLPRDPPPPAAPPKPHGGRGDL
jgi:hypothetical protein